MAELWVASRKGLFRFEPTPAGWRAGPPAFLAEPVTAVLDDPRDGTVYVALRLGHFGCKLHRSGDRGATRTELAPPAYPAADGAEGDGAAPSLDMIWTLGAGGSDEPGLIWAGTLPGGLFVSRDRGASWALVDALWERPERARWFGGGYDHPSVHSVMVDPRDARRITVGVSCGGVWRSDDGGGRAAGACVRPIYRWSRRWTPPARTHTGWRRPRRRRTGSGASTTTACFAPTTGRHLRGDQRSLRLRGGRPSR